ncbi:MAG: SpoIIE family protein phosphatase [Phycisphaeraceae bacterium]|nr:SpoIIE family protein phosphatase [Phycisphaeraceae bacterium]
MTGTPPEPGSLHGRGRSIVDFMSDGSLPRLCEELSRLSGAQIELRDARGRRIVPEGEAGWRVEEPAPGLGDGALLVPLVVQDAPIGHIALAGGERSSGEGAERAVRLVAQVSAEFCAQESALRHRVQEVELMYRLSALLIRAAEPEEVLRVALALVLEVMELDAGSIVLLPENHPLADDEAALVLKASKNLSREWLTSPLPLSRDREFDRLAIQGQVVVAEDLRTDPRVLHPDRVAAEGLASAISAGLIFQGRPMGVVRLYSRSPRRFSLADKLLLRSVAEHSALALEQARLLKIQAEERRMQRQLEMARGVQRRMLQRARPSFDGLDIWARYEPCYAIGGDFYDLFDVGGRLALAIGDAVGNGIAAALLMSGVRSSLRAHAARGLPAESVVELTNRAMCLDSLESEFVTLWYAELDPQTRRLTYCSAGHEPPFVLHGNGTHTDLSEGGLVLGVIESSAFEQRSITLEPGDTLVAYTDGIVEARNYEGAQFGRARVIEAVRHLLAEAPGASASDLCEHLLWSLRQYTGLQARLDDVTIGVVRLR